MLIIGLTGGIATGKSTVAKLLEKRGAVVVDADLAAREVVEPGQPALAEIARRFGPSVLDSDGRLDRPALGAIVFADSQARKDLETITHPRIRELMAVRIAAAAAGGAPLVVVDVPLLFEGNRDADFQGVLLVDCDAPGQLQRLIARDGTTAAAAQLRIDAQLPLELKRRRATWIIDNSDSPTTTERQVSAWWQSHVAAPQLDG